MSKMIKYLDELEAKVTSGPWLIAIESGDYFLMSDNYTKDVGTDEDLEFMAKMRSLYPKFKAVVLAAEASVAWENDPKAHFLKRRPLVDKLSDALAELEEEV